MENLENANGEEVKTLEEKVALLDEKVEKIRLMDKYNVIQKNWNSSKIRILYVACSTYVFSAIFLTLLGAYNPMLSALVPFVGVLLSFPSIPFVKRLWVKYYLSSEDSKKETKSVNLQQETEELDEDPIETIEESKRTKSA